MGTRGAIRSGTIGLLKSWSCWRCPVRVPVPCYQLEADLAEQLPHLRPAQRSGLALWVLGAIVAGSACQSAVVAALEPLGWARHATRQRLREWTLPGSARAAPCAPRAGGGGLFRRPAGMGAGLVERGDAAAGYRCHQPRGALGGPQHQCALPRLRHSGGLARQTGSRPGTLDRARAGVAGATSRHAGHHDGAGADRSRAVESAVVAQYQGPWLASADAGASDATFAPLGLPRRPARTLVPGAGHAWVGAGTAFKHRDVRRQGTLVVVWDADQAEPWIVLTDLGPEVVGVLWYGLRVWVELGFRALKSLGWHWERMRRTHPDRVARHWLVLAVATLVTLAYGTRVEDAEVAGVAPAYLRRPRALPLDPTRRRISGPAAPGWPGCACACSVASVAGASGCAPTPCPPQRQT